MSTDFSSPVLTTARLTLEAPYLEDAPDLADSLHELWLPETPSEEATDNIAQARFWIEAVREHAYSLDQLLVVGMRLTEGQNAGKMVGALSLQFTLAHHRAELGFWVHARHRGQGYAAEAIARLTDWAFSGSLKKLTALCASHNTPAVDILLRQGFRPEGYLREHFFDGRRFQDGLQLGLIHEKS